VVPGREWKRKVRGCARGPGLARRILAGRGHSGGRGGGRVRVFALFHHRDTETQREDCTHLARGWRAVAFAPPGLEFLVEVLRPGLHFAAASQLKLWSVKLALSDACRSRFRPRRRVRRWLRLERRPQRIKFVRENGGEHKVPPLRTPACCACRSSP